MVKNNDSEFGGWSSASRVIFLGGVQSFIFYGISSNLISFLTMQLGQSTAIAAQNVNAWTGFMHLVSVLTAYVTGHRTYFDRYSTILISGTFYLLGLSAITLYDLITGGWSYNSSPTSKVIFFFSLYVIGIGSAGFKTCAPAFGADQFDDRKSKSSFYKWWLFAISVGSCSSHLILNYDKDFFCSNGAFRISRNLMTTALIVIMLGGESYRSAHKKDADEVNPLEGLTNGLVDAVKKCRTTSSTSAITMQWKPTKFLKVEDVNAVLQLVPVWIICLTYPVVHSQVITFFVKQGSTMNRSIASDFQVPEGSIQLFLTVSIILFAATYDRIFAPLTRAFTGKSTAITSLVKIGGGIFVSAITMVVAGLVENRRLRIAQEYGLINDDPNITVPMVIWWLIPQYVLSGFALVLTKIGLQELFYNQVPHKLRSAGLSLYSTIFGLREIFNVFLIFAIQKVTSAGGQQGWLANNMNQGHLDYFYWFLAGLSAIDLAAFLYLAKSYDYSKQHACSNVIVD